MMKRRKICTFFLYFLVITPAAITPTYERKLTRSPQAFKGTQQLKPRDLARAFLALQKNQGFKTEFLHHLRKRLEDKVNENPTYPDSGLSNSLKALDRLLVDPEFRAVFIEELEAQGISLDTPQKLESIPPLVSLSSPRELFSVVPVKDFDPLELRITQRGDGEPFLVSMDSNSGVWTERSLNGRKILQRRHPPRAVAKLFEEADRAFLSYDAHRVILESKKERTENGLIIRITILNRDDFSISKTFEISPTPTRTRAVIAETAQGLILNGNLPGSPFASNPKAVFSFSKNKLFILPDSMMNPHFHTETHSDLFWMSWAKGDQRVAMSVNFETGKISPPLQFENTPSESDSFFPLTFSPPSDTLHFLVKSTSKSGAFEVRTYSKQGRILRAVSIEHKKVCPLHFNHGSNSWFFLAGQHLEKEMALLELSSTSGDFRSVRERISFDTSSLYRFHSYFDPTSKSLLFFGRDPTGVDFDPALRRIEMGEMERQGLIHWGIK